MVIYSILTTQSDTQFVRVYTSYDLPKNKPESNPSEQPVTDATVTISQGSSTFVFRDTVMLRNDRGSYNNPIHLYYAHPLRVEANQTYALKVVSPKYGTATSSVLVPSATTINIVTGNVLERPATRTTDVVANFMPAPNARAILVRFYIVFTADNPWEPNAVRNKEKYFEVPLLRIATNRNLEQCKILYPLIAKRVTQTPRLGADPQPLGITYPFPTYPESIAGIQRYHFNVRFKRAVFYLVQFDDPFYKYYSNANLFRDKLAIRLDEPPDYTNISGGIGLFASVRVDSAVWNLPESIQAFIPTWSDPITYCKQEAPQAAPKFDPLSWMRQ
ncbi:MAG TPA: DUF4249 family protein [Nitrososphaera sp.]|nr:DUF4249 family protein [Nitrososphaera sp.]